MRSGLSIEKAYLIAAFSTSVYVAVKLSFIGVVVPETILMIAEQPVSQKHKLLRILGVGFGLAITIGAVIGGGALRTPGVVAGHLGNEQLIIFIWG